MQLLPHSFCRFQHSICVGCRLVDQFLQLGSRLGRCAGLAGPGEVSESEEELLRLAESVLVLLEDSVAVGVCLLEHCFEMTSEGVQLPEGLGVRLFELLAESGALFLDEEQLGADAVEGLG